MSARLFLTLLLTVGLTFLLLAGTQPSYHAGEAGRFALWLVPPDDITQRSRDFHRLFEEPLTWAGSARNTATFGVNGSYLLLTKPEVARRELAALRSLGLKLNVSVPALGVDKQVCGFSVEGMIWPGELKNTALKLEEIGAAVDSFSLDLPLTNGHLSDAAGACRLSIKETAARLGAEIRGLRSVFPDAKLVDSEVPTGIPSGDWFRVLEAWLDAFNEQAHENLYGFTMDVWWNSEWKDHVRGTVDILHRRGIKAGVFLDASAGAEVSGHSWIAAAKRNACSLLNLKLPIDYLVVSNWLNMRVHNVPDSDPASLTFLLNSLASEHLCDH